jgi:translation initiation factor IF-2
MSDDQEIKQKPKATLIKHKKEEPAEADTEQDKGDKKKVVVVKKKVVVKRPLNLKVVSVKDDQIKTSEIEAPEEHEIEAAGKVEAPVQEVPVSSGHEEPAGTAPEEPHREETPVEKKAETEPPEVKETLKHQRILFESASRGEAIRKTSAGDCWPGYQRGSGYQGRPRGEAIREDRNRERQFQLSERSGYQGRPQGGGYQGRTSAGDCWLRLPERLRYQGRLKVVAIREGHKVEVSGGTGGRPPQNRTFRGKPGTTERPPFKRSGTGARAGGFRNLVKAPPCRDKGPEQEILQGEKEACISEK